MRLDPGTVSWRPFDGPARPQAVLYAISLRHAGQPQEADRLLRDVLADVADVPIRGAEGKGFAEFVAHAFLGETDAAIAALQIAVDEGWLPGWWGLGFGAFDDNYAAVLDDPRFKRLFAGIEARVTDMREAFRADPDLPPDLLRAAGLAPVGADRPFGN